jgi:hypothetical protein
MTRRKEKIGQLSNQLRKEVLHLFKREIFTTLPPCESEAVPLRLNDSHGNVLSDSHSRLLCMALTFTSWFIAE